MEWRKEGSGGQWNRQEWTNQWRENGWKASRTCHRHCPSISASPPHPAQPTTTTLSAARPTLPRLALPRPHGPVAAAKHARERCTPTCMKQTRRSRHAIVSTTLGEELKSDYYRPLRLFLCDTHRHGKIKCCPPLYIFAP